MLRIFGVKLKLLIYRMQLVFDICSSNQLLVAGHFLVKPVVDNVLFLKIIINGGNVEDWFNTYLGYLQCVSLCTNVWFMLMQVDVTISDVSLPSNWIYVQCIGYES